MDKKVLITGGAGFIGSNLTKHLIKNGYEVIVYDNLSSGKLSNLNPIIDNIKFVKADILDEQTLDENISQVDYIVHLAALVSVAESVEKPLLNQKINETAMLSLFEKARKHNIKKIVCASSAAVYGDSLDLPKQEDMSINPKSPYGVSKSLMELYAKIYNDLYNLPITCLRFFNVYGINQDPSSQYSGVLSIFINQLKNDYPSVKIFGDGKQTRDFIYIDDLVKGITLAINEKKMNGEIFNLGTGEQISLLQILLILEDITGKKINKDFYKERDGDIKYSYSTIDKIKQFNFKPFYSIESGLKDYIRKLGL